MANMKIVLQTCYYFALSGAAVSASAQVDLKPVIYNETRFKEIAPLDGALTSIECIFQDRKGLIWFGTEKGVYRYDGYKIQPWFQLPASVAVDSFWENERGMVVYMEPYDARLFNTYQIINPEAKGDTFNRQDKTSFRPKTSSRRYTILGDTAVRWADGQLFSIPGKLRGSVKCALPIGMRNKQGDYFERVYFGTRQGLYYIDGPNFDNFKPFSYFSQYGIVDLMQDNSGALWIVGSEKVWMDAFRQDESFKIIKDDRKSSESRENSVRKFAALPDGRIVILYEHGGLGIWDFNPGKPYQSVPTILAIKNFPVPGIKFNSLAALSEKRLLIGGKGAIFEIDLDRLEANRIPTSWSKDQELVAITPLKTGSEKSYLCAVLRIGGLFRYSTSQGLRYLPPENRQDATRLSYAYHLQQIPGTVNEFWVATLGYGLLRVRVNENDLTLMDSCCTQPGRRSIVTFSYSSDSTMWVGLHGGGLLHYDFVHKKELEQVDAHDGLLGKTIYSILRWNNHLFLSTDNGLALVYNSNSDSIFNYGLPDGLPHLDNNGNAGLQLETTPAYAVFGTLDGITLSNLQRWVNSARYAPVISTPPHHLQAELTIDNLHFEFDHLKRLTFWTHHDEVFKIYFPVYSYRWADREIYRIILHISPAGSGGLSSQKIIYVEPGQSISLTYEDLKNVTAISFGVHNQGQWLERKISFSAYNSTRWFWLFGIFMGAGLFIFGSVKLDRERIKVQDGTVQLLAIALKRYAENSILTSRQFLDLVRELLAVRGLDRGVFALIFRLDKRHAYVLRFDAEGELKNEENFSLGDSLEGYAFEGREIVQGKVVLIDKVRRWQRNAPTFAYFPLKDNASCFGLLALHFQEARNWDQADVALLRILAEHLPRYLNKEAEFRPARFLMRQLEPIGKENNCHFDPTPKRQAQFFAIDQFVNRKAEITDRTLRLRDKDKHYWMDHPVNLILKGLTSEARNVPLGAVWLVMYAAFERSRPESIKNPFAEVFNNSPNRIPNNRENSIWRFSNMLRDGADPTDCLQSLYDFFIFVFFDSTRQNNVQGEVKGWWKANEDREKIGDLGVVLTIADTRRLEANQTYLREHPPASRPHAPHIVTRNVATALYWVEKDFAEGAFACTVDHNESTIQLSFFLPER